MSLHELRSDSSDKTCSSMSCALLVARALAPCTPKAPSGARAVTRLREGRGGLTDANPTAHMTTANVISAWRAKGCAEAVAVPRGREG